MFPETVSGLALRIFISYLDEIEEASTFHGSDGFSPFRSLENPLSNTCQIIWDSIYALDTTLLFIYIYIYTLTHIHTYKHTRAHTHTHTLITGRCSVFCRWRTERSWRTGLLGVVKWRGVGVYLLQIIATRSAALREAERITRTNMTLSLLYWLTPSTSFENSHGQTPCTAHAR